MFACHAALWLAELKKYHVTLIKRRLAAKAENFDFFSIACDESTDASDTAQLLIFF